MSDGPGVKNYSDSATDDKFRKEVSESFERANVRISRMEQELLSNTAKTDAVFDNTTEIIEIFKAVKGGLKMLEWMGQAAKWVGGIAIAVGAIWKVMGWKSPFN